MSYYIDLTAISIDEFKKRLLEQKMYPSQRILLDNIDDNFDKIIEAGINNMQELNTRIKNKDKATQFSKELGIDYKYMQMLRREVASYHPKPRKIAEYEIIDDSIKTKLLERGIRNTLQLYDLVKTK